MPIDAYLTLALIVLTFLLLIRTNIPVAAIFFGALAMAMTLKLAPPADLLKGFSNQGTLTVGVLYIVALALLLVGTFGLFGQERDPLSGVFLLPLGLPWNLLADSAPEPAWPWLAAASPLLNLLILITLCKASRRGR